MFISRCLGVALLMNYYLDFMQMVIVIRVAYCNNKKHFYEKRLLNF